MNFGGTCILSGQIPIGEEVIPVKHFNKILVAVLVALAVIIPLSIALATSPSAPQAIVRIADQPTPTPTPWNSGGGCLGGAC